jgi:hypothetical protein
MGIEFEAGSVEGVPDHSNSQLMGQGHPTLTRLGQVAAGPQPTR